MFSVLVALALLSPLDCFAATPRTREAADCCLQAKCAPKATSDECCKNKAPERDRLGPNSSDHQPAAGPLSLVAVLSLNPLVIAGLNEPVKHPPPRLELIPSSLPLLI